MHDVAAKDSDYIRPIILFQAEEKGREVAKEVLLKHLLEIKLPIRLTEHKSWEDASALSSVADTLCNTLLSAAGVAVNSTTQAAFTRCNTS